MFKKKLIIVALIVTLAFSLGGCISSHDENDTSDGNTTDNLVWDTNSGDSSNYIGIKYPNDWIVDFEDVDEVEVEFEVIADDTKEVGLDIELDLHKDMEDDYYKNISSEDEFYSYMENLVSTVSGDIVIYENKRISLDGYPAYKVIYSEDEGTEYACKIIWITVYKNGFFGDIRYYAKHSRYDNYEAIANEMIESIAFLK